MKFHYKNLFSSRNLKKKTKFCISTTLILFLNQNSIVFTLKMNFFYQNFVIFCLNKSFSRKLRWKLTFLVQISLIKTIFYQNFSEQVIFTKITLKINFSYWNFIIKTFFLSFFIAKLEEKNEILHFQHLNFISQLKFDRIQIQNEHFLSKFRFFSKNKPFSRKLHWKLTFFTEISL